MLVILISNSDLLTVCVTTNTKIDPNFKNSTPYLRTINHKRYTLSLRSKYYFAFYGKLPEVTTFLENML